MNGARRTPFGVCAALAVLAAWPMALPAAVSCTVSGVGPAFGTYNLLSAAPTYANGQLTVTCTLTGPRGRGRGTVTPVWSASTGASGGYGARWMLSGSNRLNYNLYLDPAYTLLWGDGTGGSQTGSARLRLRRRSPTQSVTAPIYGRIPALQSPAAGTFADTLIVTVTY